MPYYRELDFPRRKSIYHTVAFVRVEVVLEKIAAQAERIVLIDYSGEVRKIEGILAG